MTKSITAVPPAAVLSVIAEKGKRVPPKLGKVFFSQGEPANALFYIESGRVKVSTTSHQGKEAIVALLGRGDFFGEACLTGQARRVSTVVAITESSVLRFEKEVALRLIRDETKFSELFVTFLLARNVRMEADLIDQLFNSSEKRLARALLLMANFGKDGAPQPLPAKISQAALAQMIGTTRSRVSFFMNKFKRLGFIEYSGHLEVHNSLLSVLLYDDPDRAETRIEL
jgi:CRP-like cAMP-binding protein